MKKILHLIATLLMITALVATMTACSGGGTGNGGNGGNSGEGGNGNGTGTGTENGSGNTDTKVEYTVSVKTIGGRPFSKLAFLLYDGDDLVAYGQTDSEGVGKVSAKPSDNYTVVLSGDLDGYDVKEEGYSFTNKAANIVLTSHVIEDSDLAGVQYGVGDIIRDFTVRTTDGTSITLSEVLKTKKAVLINFWYSTCSPCINEFPYMQSAYDKYKDDIEVIALNNYPSDSESTIKIFKETYGLSFPVAKDYSGIGNAFGVNAYPTSILVDRYGTICLIEVGGLTSEKPFVAVFEHFTADEYNQQLFESIDELTPIELPNVEMPSSDEIGAALNGNGFSAEYAPETGSADAEYSWPFVVGVKDGASCVIPANSYKDSSFATLHATVTMSAGQALAIDWFADTELSVDTLFILVDGKDIIQISGVSEEWKTCYPFVATEDGTYKVSFIYLKDSDTDVGDDLVYLKNFRTVDISAIDSATYIPRQAATKPNANGLGFQNYVSAVYNPADGYYHVGTANGPLLLANLMGSTLLSETSLNDLGYNGELVDKAGDIYVALVDYCNYSINGTLYGYSPVTAELKDLLVRAAEIVGFERGNADQWLQTCSYYDAYATDGKQLDDPVKGIAFFAALDTVLSDTEIKYNTVEYDGRVIMPRGLKYKFVPTVSGAYLIKSQSKDQVDGWIFNDKHEIIHTASIVDRPYGSNTIDTVNVSMLIYLEAGKTYYIDIAYYDIYAAGTFTFTVEYLGATYEHFHLASPGYFTYTENATGQLNQTIAGGIDVALGADGYYHELLADGTLGSIVYADFKYSTGLFTHSILKMIELGGFNFTYNDTDQEVLAKLNELGGDKAACIAYYKELWGDSYDEYAANYNLVDVLDGKTHGNGKNLTDEISKYISKMITGGAPELEGCVAVDADLAKLLQAIMDKYTFSGVNNSWTKLCYYYKTLG